MSKKKRKIYPKEFKLEAVRLVLEKGMPGADVARDLGVPVLITPLRIHKHRYCGVLAPNAKLRRAVIESAGPAGATLQLLQEAQQQMGL